ncbi:hypothetical protein [Stenotrophomonas sp. S39]|uniref:hypothetical protein n=1 Tax=Stenotrophomonas sp. S39 TaxID=2767451 RepID=UPI00190AF6C8|nr:hypothetical protein [Stenotrophomonas sp. S39]MBK0052976.1 hypothetical protein [Stenotrophomonas sp. S39]
MNLIDIAGQVSRDTDLNTTNLLKKNIQFAEGQAESRQIEQDQLEEKRERHRMRSELEAIQYGQEKAREVEELKSKLSRAEYKNEVLRDLAADVILDRSSIRNTVSFLKSKWAAPSQAEEFEADFNTLRQNEKQQIEEDEGRQNKAYQLVDDVVNSWSKPSSTRRRRPPGLKP